MLSSPKPGRRVILWYKDRTMPHHGKEAVVETAGRKRPRNHLVILADTGERVVVPAGNLRRPN